MEVFTAFTPICSRNYKAILESLQDDLSDTPKIFHSRASKGPRQGSGTGCRRADPKKSYELSGIRRCCPVETSTDERLLISMISATKACVLAPSESWLASDQRVSPGATVTVMKRALVATSPEVPDAVLAPASPPATDATTIARERTTRVRAKRPRRLSRTDGLIEKP